MDHTFANVPSTLLLVSTASLTEFGRVCGLSVPADRFRANLEVDINPPFAEMEWPLGSGVQVGKVAFEAAGHCVRCQAVDVDPEAGSSSKPSLLSALATMQQSDGKGPTFGVLVRAHRDGPGDHVAGGPDAQGRGRCLHRMSGSTLPLPAQLSAGIFPPGPWCCLNFQKCPSSELVRFWLYVIKTRSF